MRKVKVSPGQTIFDLALMHTGSIMGVVAIAKLNGLTIGDELEAGAKLLVGAIIDADMFEALAREGISAATAWPHEILNPSAGDYWLSGGEWQDLPWTDDDWITN